MPASLLCSWGVVVVSLCSCLCVQTVSRCEYFHYIIRASKVHRRIKPFVYAAVGRGGVGGKRNNREQGRITRLPVPLEGRKTYPQPSVRSANRMLSLYLSRLCLGTARKRMALPTRQGGLLKIATRAIRDIKKSPPTFHIWYRWVRECISTLPLRKSSRP